MKIGVIGWWNNGNQGDFAILRSWMHSLAPHRVIPIDSAFYMNRDVLQRLNQLDFVILGGGGLFTQSPTRPFDTFDKWGGDLTTPIGVAGLGVDVVPPDYRAAVNALVQQSRFFFVRDQASGQIIGNPKVQARPDLTFALPVNFALPAKALPSQPPLCGINLRGIPGLDVEQWISALQQLPVKLRAIPFSTLGEWQESNILQRLDPGGVAAFDSSLYAGVDLMIGMAFHSVVFAVQAAVPVIAIAYAPKVEQFMHDIGLQDYVLRLNEWHRLPELVERALAERAQLTAHLRTKTSALTELARHTMTEIKSEIEQVAQRHTQAKPRVSIVVIGHSSDTGVTATLESCLNQTHDNLEVILLDDKLAEASEPTRPALKVVDDGRVEDPTEHLNRAFGAASGDFLSWIKSGDLYACDAIAYLADRLQSEPACDVVYTDYYFIDEQGHLAGVYPVDSPRKLFRGNVIGPSVLLRRDWVKRVGPFRADSAWPEYEYWLRAQATSYFRAVHVPLLYRHTHNVLANLRATERAVRARWRAGGPWLARIFWHWVDADWTERWVIGPLKSGLRLARRWSSS
jgi:polysaccharide pyruvyl transferase WcaK-like protein